LILAGVPVVCRGGLVGGQVWKDYVEGAEKAEEEAAAGNGLLGGARWGAGAAQQGKQEVMQVGHLAVLCSVYVLHIYCTRTSVSLY